MEDYEQSWCPKGATSDENIELVHRVIVYDRRRSLHDIARQIGLSFGAESILTNRVVQGLS